MAQMQSFLLIKTWITQSQRKFLLVIFKMIIFNVDFVYEKILFMKKQIQR